MDDVELTIGLCAYQEAANLRVLLPRIQASAAMFSGAYEVLVVDTSAAVDDTEAVCREMGVRHVRRNGGNAYGDAVRTMIAEARGDFLLNMDADGSHRAKDIAALWSLREEYGIVIGSRYVDGGGSRNPVRLRWMSWCLSATFRWVTGLAVQDFSNSLRLYRRELIVGLVLKAANFDVLQELLAQAVTAHPEMRIGEVPVMFARRVSGRSKRVGVVFLWSYAQMLWKLRRLRNADSPRE